MKRGASPLVLKVGGDLLDHQQALERIAAMTVHAARRGPTVVVHGGGREIDRELAARGSVPQAVDGLRVTDAATLDVVLSVLVGRLNTRLVGALSASGVRAVGLTGADAGLVRVVPAGPYRTARGAVVDLGWVGRPVDGTPELLERLCRLGYVPVVASIGVGPEGHLYNVNADTFAAFLAGRLGARRLLIAGTTAGVLDEHGRSIPRLPASQIDHLVASGRVAKGMVAKLYACREALAAGVREVAIVDGRARARLDRLPGTLVVVERLGRPRPARSGRRGRPVHQRIVGAKRSETRPGGLPKPGRQRSLD